jgi:hypothetical protein
MILFFFCAGRLALGVMPHPEMKPLDLEDWMMMKELHLFLGSCLISAILAMLLHRRPFMLRVEDRMCSFGTGIAEMTMVVYAVVLPFCMALELASVFSGGQMAVAGARSAPPTPAELALLSGQAAKEEMDLTPAARCTQCNRPMPKGKNACMYCGPALPLDG